MKSPDPPVAGGSRRPDVARETEPVGRITGMADCRWTDPEDAPPSGAASVPLGRKYALNSGLLEITYQTGAKVILQGPCTYEVDSAAGGFLSLGKLTARVEKRGERIRGSEDQKPIRNPSSPIPSPLFVRPHSHRHRHRPGHGVRRRSGRRRARPNRTFSSARCEIALVGGNGEPGQTATLRAGETARCGRSEGIVRSAAPANAARFVRSLQPASARLPASSRSSTATNSAPLSSRCHRADTGSDTGWPNTNTKSRRHTSGSSRGATSAP